MNWRTIIPKMFFHCCEGSEISPENLESPGNLTLNASRIWFQDFHRTEETEIPLLEGKNKILCAPGPREKEQWPHNKWNQVYLLELEGLLRRCGSAVDCLGDGDTGSSSPWIPPSPPSGILQKPLSLIHQRTDRRIKNNYHPAAYKRKTIITEI